MGVIKMQDKSVLKKKCQRCHHCNTKLKLMSFPCKCCQYTFCVKHQYTHAHDCKRKATVKADHMKRIADTNPKMLKPKVQAI